MIVGAWRRRRLCSRPSLWRHPVGQCQRKNRLDVSRGYRLRAVEGRMGTTRADHRQIRAQGLDVVFGDPRRHVVQHLSRYRDAADASLAAASADAIVACASTQARPKLSGSRLNARRRSSTSHRTSTSDGASTSTASANRSSNCGRRVPSSGFIEPNRTKSVAWLALKPSRSTMCTPLATASRSASAR